MDMHVQPYRPAFEARVNSQADHLVRLEITENGATLGITMDRERWAELATKLGEIVKDCTCVTACGGRWCAADCAVCQ